MSLARVRTWPALLTLLWLSPAIGELLSGSTPPLRFIQPFALVFLPTLYGVSAILIHEIIARRALGWGNALLMGAAFGVFQEALVVQTWFNFVAPSSPSHSVGQYGVVWATSWSWALNLTLYHAVISITTPLILISLFFPRVYTRPWLRARGVCFCIVWLLLLCGALAINVAFRQFVQAGYTHPPLVPYLMAVALTAGFMLAGALIRFPPVVAAPLNTASSAQAAPGLWRLRLSVFAWVTLYFLGIGVLLPALRLPAALGMALGVALAGVALWRVRVWSARPGWSARHLLAVATGVVMYFTFVWGPLVEFSLRLPQENGLVIADLLAFAGLLLFDARLKRRPDAFTTIETIERATERQAL